MVERIEQALEKAARTAAPQVVALHAPSAGGSLRSVVLNAEHLERNRVVAGLDDAPTADIYRVLRTRLLAQLGAGPGRVVAITSANAGEGKTLTAVNLAMSLSRHTAQAVTLVDFDLRKPGVAATLGVHTAAGVADYLRGAAELAQCAARSGTGSLTVIAGRGSCTDSSELLASHRVGSLLDTLRREHPAGVILLDLPPLLAADDTLVVLPHCTGVLLVLEEGRTQRADARRAIELVGNRALLGTVLNRARGPH